MPLMLFRTAGFQPAHAHEAGWKPAVRKSMNGDFARSHSDIRAQALGALGVIDRYLTNAGPA